MSKILKGTEDKLGVNSGGLLLFIILLVIVSIGVYAPGLRDNLIAAFIVLSPIWVPLALIAAAWRLWVIYIRAKYIAKREMTLLEVRIPREIKKTPFAMETVFNSLHFGPGEQTWFDKYVKGSVRPWWSFELVSINGELHFFIWTTEFFRNVLEAAIYAQYPEVEITKAEDYARLVDFKPGELSLWGSDIVLTGADPIPIKTYIDYGLDKEGSKPEEIVDPFASVLELMGSLQKGEQVWIQILVQQSKGTWRKEGEEKIDEIKNEVIGKKDAEGNIQFGLIDERRKTQMDAIGRSIGKNGFDVGIRLIYMAEEGKFRPSNISGMLGTLKQFNSGNLNGFKPTRYLAKFNFPWQKWFKREIRARRRVLNAYRRRSWFHGPYKTKPFVLNSEELATLYHFPGSVVQTPTVARIPSRREEAPPNLPV